MTMYATKKAKVEQRLVLGLLVFFGLTLWGALRNMGFFRSQAPVRNASAGAVDLSKPLAQTFQDYWKRMEPQPEPQSARAPSAASATPLYTAQSLRDPLQNLLPALPASAEGASGQGTLAQAPKEPAHVPAFTVQGVWWSDAHPRAIINGDVYGVGDRVDGVTITSIDRDGITVDVGGKAVTVALGHPQESAKAAGSHATQWR